MKTITLLSIGVIYLLSVCFALNRGYDVKAAFKLPFVVFTFEANGDKKRDTEAKPVIATPTKLDNDVHPIEAAK